MKSVFELFHLSHKSPKDFPTASTAITYKKVRLKKTVKYAI